MIGFVIYAFSGVVIFMGIYIFVVTVLFLHQSGYRRAAFGLVTLAASPWVWLLYTAGNECAAAGGFYVSGLCVRAAPVIAVR